MYEMKIVILEVQEIEYDIPAGLDAMRQHEMKCCKYVMMKLVV